MDQKCLDEKYMRRALALAGHGRGTVAPNPLVGAVIVYNGNIIGEDYHRCYGKAHAEVNAIASVQDTALLSQSTLYVTLEPCSHYGKTPPCVELILSKKIPRVVIGCQDPFPEVAGRGIKRLREAGVEVVVGCLNKECEEMIRPFSTFYTKFRPYIILKWAQSADGFIDKIRFSLSDGLPAKISDPLVSYEVHKLRSEVDAILVGTNTALLDNPVLTTRFYFGRNPLRITIDKEDKIPENAALKRGDTDTLIFTSKEKRSQKNLEYMLLNPAVDSLSQLLSVLYKRNKQSLLVEGGACLLTSFMEKGLWDEIRIERSGIYLGDGVRAPLVRGIPAKSIRMGSSVVDCYYSEA
ncbi:MAG: bifunctional diaminohydroxyphosphoribosylaminopyrimidine deaminase/5-amino-6-(5-phosphoribosylamino)uracil reductase RibD [Bacteroidales bacterium]|nr:bifunctional diaminohydroxyphosphoribosylaminopyrimidine deaminase/5-amino-6-(5-phosphoribosylamino)uracil reductase RibD [Bacteroidales bacterium]